jgi:hemerythrin
MAGELEVIDQVIAQHKIIRLNLQGVQTSLTDFDALFSLQKAQSGWAQSSVDKLLDQKRQLQDALNRVQKGLNAHFSYEEEALPPLFGKAFTRALLVVHREIRQYIEKTISMANSTKLEGLSQPELLTEKSHLQEATNTLGQMVEQHANTEEQMLAMLRRAFSGEATSPRAD